MKPNQGRVRANAARESSKNQPSTESSTPPGAPAGKKSESLVPSQAVKEMEAVLSDLRRAAETMVALALISADYIRKEAEGYQEWEDLDRPGFQNGVVELARNIAGCFEGEFGDWTGFLGFMMDPLRSRHDAVKLLNDVNAPLPGLPAPDNTGDLEWAVCDLALWGEKLSLLVANRDSRCGGVRVVIEAADCLEAAWDRALKATGQLRRAFQAVEAARLVKAV